MTVLQIETSLAKKNVKPSLETVNVIDVIVYGSYIYSQIKKIKISNVKKKLKSANFALVLRSSLNRLVF